MIEEQSDAIETLCRELGVRAASPA
jgi:hypothetical protein